MNNKLFKKFSIFMSCLFMFMAVSIPVFATPSIGGNSPSQGSITITKEGSVFTAYKVMNVIKDGDAYNYTPTDSFKNFFNNPNYGSYTETILGNIASNSNELRDFSSYLHQYIVDNKVEGIRLNNGQKNIVDLGYYLIAETETNSEGATVASVPILTQVPTVSGGKWNYDIKIKPKDSTPTLEKYIIKDGKKLKTCSTSIGDKIKFEIDADVPVYQSNSKNIKYHFTDKLSKGFTFDSKSTPVITIGDTTLSPMKNYIFDAETSENGETEINIDFNYDSLKNNAGQPLKISYEATLTDKAEQLSTPSDGNTNEVSLQYTKNPDIVGNYNTLTDKVSVYTWRLNILKVDAKLDKPLQGAEFKLCNDEGEMVGKIVTTDDKGKISFSGLKEGNYTLIETKAPAGHKQLQNPIQLTITPNTDNKGEYTGEAFVDIKCDIFDKTPVAFYMGSSYNNLTLKVLNFSGYELPNTGGLGTNGFAKTSAIVFGIVCVLGLLGLGYHEIDKRRTNN